MLKLPSIQSLLGAALHTLKRFPLVLLCATFGAAVSLYLVDLRYDDKEDAAYLYHLLITASLGLTLFLSTELYNETKGVTSAFRIISNLAGAGLLVVYYLLLPPRFEQIELYRYFLFSIGLHLLVSFSPFIARGSINGFWQFNKTIFLRILLSALYTGVLYLGLVLAMAAVEHLFNVHIGDKNYFRLWIILAGVFNTWFFLAGIPKDLTQLNEETDYPKGLKVFTQFVLLPLVTIYLFILYAYLARIIITWQLPKGWVSYLVIGFSVAGILSLLLIYPIRNEEGNGWIRIFTRWFYRAIYPLIVLLLIAIYKRIHDYGITENRYYILVLAVWLASIAAYFLLSPVKNIKVIPVSLCLIAFLSSFGPWSSFSVSKRSQLNRLEGLLSSNGILVHGKISRQHPKITYRDNVRITSILEYLDGTHELYVLQPWFDQPMDSVFHNTGNDRYVYRLGDVHTAMGIEQVNTYYSENEFDAYQPFYYYRKEETYRYYKNIKGFDYLLNLNLYTTGRETVAFGRNDTLVIRLDTLNGSVHLQKNKLRLDLSLQWLYGYADTAYINSSYNNGGVPAAYMLIEKENEQMSVKLDLNSINGEIRKNKRIVKSVYGDLYITFKDSLMK